MEPSDAISVFIRDGTWFRKYCKGRNPKDVWAFVQRTCGVCTTTHAIASIRAVENALELMYHLMQKW